MAISKKHNLSFTDEEMGIEAQKLNSDTPKTRKDVKPKKTMKTKKSLQFEEDKVKPSERLKANAKDSAKYLPIKASSNRFHRQVDEDNADDNVSVDAVNKGSELTEDAVHKVKTHERRQSRKATDKSTVRTREEKQAERDERKAAREERQTDRKYISEQFKAEQEKIKTENPQYKANPYSKWKQKQEIKKQYYAAKTENSSTAVATFGDKVKESAKKATEEGGSKIAEFASNNKGVLVVVGGILALIIGISVLGSSGGVIAQSGTGALAMTSYPSDDAEMLAAEDYYCTLESQLQTAISTYESTHSYNEYHYNLDPISHDPYELTSILTAKNEDAYTASEIKTFETSVYSNQYKLSQRVVTETRYRSEIRYRLVTYYNADGTTSQFLERYTVSVPYSYYICYVTLVNYGIDHAAEVLLDNDQKDMYEIYNETKGNREDLFS